MVLTDVISEYLFVYQTLDPCKDYFYLCNKIIDDYMYNTDQLSTKYFNHNSSADGYKNEVISGLSQTYDTIYKQILKLITLNYSFFSAMIQLEKYDFKLLQLKTDIIRFLQLGEKVKDITNDILIEQLSGLKTNKLLSSLFDPLKELTKLYYSLVSLYSHFQCIDEFLMEKVPEDVLNDEKYNSIEIRSYSQNMSFSQYAKDLSLLSSFMDKYEMISNDSGIEGKIYLRKVESGSLRIVCGSTTFELKSISEIVRAIVDGIRTFRLTSTEKEMQKEQVRALRLENDKKELAIINSQIKNISTYLGLSPDDPEDVEKMQSLCLPLVRYIHNNPVGKVGEFYYDLTTELKLLEDFYMHN